MPRLIIIWWKTVYLQWRRYRRRRRRRTAGRWVRNDKLKLNVCGNRFGCEFTFNAKCATVDRLAVRDVGNWPPNVAVKVMRVWRRGDADATLWALPSTNWTLESTSHQHTHHCCGRLVLIFIAKSLATSIHWMALLTNAFLIVSLSAGRLWSCCSTHHRGKWWRINSLRLEMTLKSLNVECVCMNNR